MLYFSRFVSVKSPCRHPLNLILQNEAQSIDAVHTYIGDWTPTRHRGIVDPLPGMSLFGGKRKLRPCENWLTDLTCCHAVAQYRCTLLKAKHVRDSQRNFCCSCRFHHLSTLLSIDTHRFLAQHGFSAFN